MDRAVNIAAGRFITLRVAEMEAYEITALASGKLLIRPTNTLLKGEAKPCTEHNLIEVGITG